MLLPRAKPMPLVAPVGEHVVLVQSVKQKVLLFESDRPMLCVDPGKTGFPTCAEG